MAPLIRQLGNTGVYFKERPEDFKAGSETNVQEEVRLESGDWEAYKPTDEWQRKKVGNNLGYDTLSCVTFSAINSVEMQIELLIEKGEVSEETQARMKELGYFDEDGKVNFNEWFSSILNGTTADGNFLQAPWDSFRKDGLLPQKDGKNVNDFATQSQWLDIRGITEAMREKAKKFNEMFEIKYEWVVYGKAEAWKDFDKHVKHAPLHVLLPTDSNWNKKDGVVPDPKLSSVNHATLYIGKTKAFKKNLDHYNPFVKKLANNYYMPYAMKGVVSVKKPQETPPPFTYTFTKKLTFGDPASEEVHKLQEALQYLKDKNGKPYMAVGTFGRFGEVTRSALGRLQTDNGITDQDTQGTNFGPRTREVVNKLLKV